MRAIVLKSRLTKGQSKLNLKPVHVYGMTGRLTRSLAHNMS